MSTTNIDPRWADIDFDKVNAELRDLRAQVGRLQAHIDRTQPVVAGADGYVEPEAPKALALLTDEQLTVLWIKHRSQKFIDQWNFASVVRCAEAAHGIGGPNA